jgi:hypothetical protein
MKKLISLLVAVLLVAALSPMVFAGAINSVGDTSTEFNNDTTNNNVNYEIQDPTETDTDGNPVTYGISVWEDAYAVDVIWGALSFIYVLENDDDNNAIDLTNNWKATWNTVDLKWDLTFIGNTGDEEYNPEEGLEGEFDLTEFVYVHGIFTVDVDETATATSNLFDLTRVGNNGMVVINRSSQDVTASFAYTQNIALYSATADAFGARAAATIIPAVSGEAGEETVATVSALHNFISDPDTYSPLVGNAGRITITIN